MNALRQLVYAVLLIYDMTILFFERKRKNQPLSPWDMLTCGKRAWLDTDNKE